MERGKERILEYREGDNIAPKYYCGNCKILVRDFRHDEILKAPDYNYCPFCGMEIDWNNPIKKEVTRNK